VTPTRPCALTPEDMAIERRNDHRDPPFHHMILYRMVTTEREHEMQYGGRRTRVAFSTGVRDDQVS
jgi:hypothetical protein